MDPISSEPNERTAAVARTDNKPKYRHLEWTDEQVARFWDYESQYPDRYFAHQYGDVIIARLQRFLHGHEQVLDFGCGMGSLVGHLLRRGHRAAGADFSPRSIEQVRSKFAGKSLFLGAFDPRHLVTQGRTFDAVLVVEVIEHLNDAMLSQTLRTIRRITRPGGVVIFTTPNDEQLDRSEVFCPECTHIFHRFQHVRSWNTRSLRNSLERESFSVTHAFTTDFQASFRRHKYLTLRSLVTRLVHGRLSQPNLVVVGRPEP